MIEAIGDFLQRHLTVFLAVVLVPLKIAVIRFCRDREGEAGAILSIPEDLCYVALGLILSDLLNATGALHQYFRSSHHPSIDIAVVVGLNVAFALVVHLLSQPTLRSYKNWRGADAARMSDTPIQSELEFVLLLPIKTQCILSLII